MTVAAATPLSSTLDVSVCVCVFTLFTVGWSHFTGLAHQGGPGRPQLTQLLRWFCAAQLYLHAHAYSLMCKVETILLISGLSDPCRYTTAK